MIESDPIDQHETSIEGNWCVWNLAYPEQLVDADIGGWSADHIKQMIP